VIVILTSTSVDSGTSRRTFVLKEFPAIIGRSDSAHVFLDDHRVSRRHCEICQDGAMLMVRDLGSKNGTFVDKMPITQAVLAPGSKLTVARIEFVVNYRRPGEVQITTEDALDKVSSTDAPKPKTAKSGDTIVVKTAKRDKTG
jgi:pSer/pThr/pTyr-binding forkhead associated (FHA) protein